MKVTKILNINVFLYSLSKPPYRRLSGMGWYIFIPCDIRNVSTDRDSTVQFIVILVIPPTVNMCKGIIPIKKNLPNCTERHGILNYLLGV